MEKANPPADEPLLPRPKANDAKTERLAAALRANLKRRKAADRNRRTSSSVAAAPEDDNGGDACGSDPGEV